MRAQTHTHIQTHTHTRFSLFDDDEEEPLHLLILWPLKDKVFGSAVTELGQTVSRNTLQTDPMDRAVARHSQLMRVMRECRLRLGQS